MNYQFKMQYHHTEILDRAKKYLEKREKNGTTGEAEDRIMEQAGWRLVNSKFDIRDATAVVRWKSHRPLWLFVQNEPSDVEAAIRAATAATRDGDVRRAVTALTILKGVGLKMASAILNAMFPALYTVCDVRASESLGQKDYGSLRYYVAYLTACRRMAAQYGVILRDFDRANWHWTWEQSQNKRKRQCPKQCTGYTMVGVAVAA